MHVANKPSIEIKRLRQLSIEIFKTIYNLNPSYMKEIFILNTQRGSESKNLYVQSHRAKNYGENSLKTLGPKIWNSLPDHFKVSRSLDSFKELINTWTGTLCKCSMCTYLSKEKQCQYSYILHLIYFIHFSCNIFNNLYGEGGGVGLGLDPVFYWFIIFICITFTLFLSEFK